MPNDASATTCVACGAVLKAGISPASPGPQVPTAPEAGGPLGYEPPTYGPPAYGYPGAYIPDYSGIERERQVSRTKWGVLVLAGAMLVGLIPVFGLVCLALVLYLVGIVLMAIGRRPFGERHSKFVMASVVLVVVYVVAIVLLTFWFFFTIIGIAQTGALEGLSTTFWAYLGGITVAGFLEALAWVLFVHELETPAGRYLLYGAFIALIVLQVVVLALLSSQINTLLAGIANGTITDPNDPRITELQGFSTTLSIVGAIPTILFAGAYIMAYLRLERREIPAEPAPVVAAPPAYPYVPAVGPTAPPSPPAPGPPEGPPGTPPP